MRPGITSYGHLDHGVQSLGRPGCQQAGRSGGDVPSVAKDGLLVRRKCSTCPEHLQLNSRYTLKADMMHSLSVPVQI